MFDGTYLYPPDTPKKADFTDCTQRRPKEAKESRTEIIRDECMIIETKAAYPAWDEGLRLYNEDMQRIVNAQYKYLLRPIYKGLHNELDKDDRMPAMPSSSQEDRGSDR